MEIMSCIENGRGGSNGEEDEEEEWTHLRLHLNVISGPHEGEKPSYRIKKVNILTLFTIISCLDCL